MADDHAKRVEYTARINRVLDHIEADDRPAFELYGSKQGEGPDAKHEVAICVPVRPM
jgi:hypothetical protein